MKQLGILASARGTNLKAIIDACHAGELPATPVIVISNNSGALALTRAREAGIPVAHISTATHGTPEAVDEAILAELLSRNVDLVITAGYMKKLGPKTMAAFKHRIVNVHPSLLPKYGGHGMYGMNVHRAVIEHGDAETGISIHYVEGEYDTGPVIAQKRIPVLPDDTPESLAERVLAQEHAFLIETIGRLLAEQGPD